MIRSMTLFRRAARLVVTLPLAALLYAPSPGFAAPFLGTDLASFAVLGATPSVTNTGATTVFGDVGVSPAASITGQSSLTVNGIIALLNPGDVHLNDATATLAQGQLANARTQLGLLGPGSLQPADLGGLTLFPGVYTVPAGVTNLTGTLTLDGQGNANAAWVFQMPSTLITSPGSIVNVINTGTGAGVYWNVGSAATLGTTTAFEGNILALATITLNHAATIGRGRALSQSAAVTLDGNTINALGWTGSWEDGSYGLSGGLEIIDTPGGPEVAFLRFAAIPGGGGAPVPEPSTFLLLVAGLIGVGTRARRARARSTTYSS